MKFFLLALILCLAGVAVNDGSAQAQYYGYYPRYRGYSSYYTSPYYSSRRSYARPRGYYWWYRSTPSYRTYYPRSGYYYPGSYSSYYPYFLGYYPQLYSNGGSYYPYMY